LGCFSGSANLPIQAIQQLFLELLWMLEFGHLLFPQTDSSHKASFEAFSAFSGGSANLPFHFFLKLIRPIPMIRAADPLPIAETMV
jgi:hypothetical protein